MTMPIVVAIEDFSYVPESVTINAGDEVVWENRDKTVHSATRTETPEFDTGNIKPGTKSNPIVFSDRGEISYFCRPHRFMIGNINIV